MLKLYRLRLCVLLQLLLSCVCYAQRIDYQPYHPTAKHNLQELAKSQQKALSDALMLPKEVSNNYRKDFEGIREVCGSIVYHTIAEKALLDTVLHPLAQRVFNQLLSSNKQLPAAKLLLIKSPVTNAYTFAGGTILFNTGLVAELENEDQLAFIMSHELAHVFLDHASKGIREHLNLVHNAAFQKEYKRIVRQEYNMYAKLNSLVTNASVNKLYHNRLHEQQADSLGFILMQNAGFDRTQAHAALELLGKSESMAVGQSMDYNKHLGCPNTSQLLIAGKRAKSIFEVSNEKEAARELNDTLKTHPNIPKRILYLKALAEITPATPAAKYSAAGNFEYAKAASAFEVIQSWYSEKRYDRALYETLNLLEVYPEQPYLRTMTLVCLLQLKNHLKSHQYADVVSSRKDYNTSSFNDFLDILHNLNIADFANLASCFNAKYPHSNNGGEYGLIADYAYSVLIENVAAAESLKQRYVKVYSKGQFYDSLFKQ